MSVTVPAKESITKIIEEIKQISYRHDFLSRKLSELDGLRNDIEHYIELERLKLWEYTKLAYKLRDVQRERRAVKDELKLLTDFRGTLSMGVNKYGAWLVEELDKIDNQVYKPRTKTLKELLED